MGQASDVAERALRLCQIPSPIGHEKQVADEVELWARMHFPPEQVIRRSNSFVLGTLNDPRPTVALIGHLDTVPPFPDARPAAIEGRRLYGLGASDMKGGVAVMMAVAESARREALNVNLVIVLYEGEEGPVQDSGLGILLDQLPDLGRVAFVVALEPTDNVVQVGCVGCLNATLSFHGKAAHSARPWQGKNAVHLAGPLLSHLLSLPPREVTLDGFTYAEVFSVTSAQGGRANNVVPDAFELNLNYRFAPGKTVAQAQQEVLRLVGDHAKVTFTELGPSARVCADSRYFQQLVKVTGNPASAKQAWTDVARFTERGAAAVNFGPGETAQAHQENESVALDALEFAFDRLRGFLRSL